MLFKEPLTTYVKYYAFVVIISLLQGKIIVSEHAADPYERKSGRKIYKENKNEVVNYIFPIFRFATQSFNWRLKEKGKDEGGSARKGYLFQGSGFSRVGLSLVEVYERVGRTFNAVYERP